MMTLEIVDNRKKDVTTFRELNVGDLFVCSERYLYLKVNTDRDTNCIFLETFDCSEREDEDEVTRVSGKLVLE